MGGSLIPVVISAVAGYAVGALWYSPLVYGKQWMKLTGMTKKKIEKASMGQMYLLGFLNTLVMAAVLHVLIKYIGVSTPLLGAAIGSLVWLGFMATTLMHSVLYERKPWALWLINSSHGLVSLVVMGAILGAW